MSTDADRRWNHNIHYYDRVIDALPPNARTALDVGTGDGLLASRLRRRVPDVTGIDVDPGVLHRARAAHDDVTWVLGDVLRHPLPLAHYDLVAAVAVLHHLPDAAAALRRLAELTAPGGALAVIGCARSSTPLDYAMDAVGAVQHRVLSRTRGYWEHSAPVRTDFPQTFSEARTVAAAALPGMVWRRLPLFRYAVVWRKAVDDRT